MHGLCLRGDPFYCSTAKRRALDESLSESQNRKVRERSSENLPKREEVSVVSGIFGLEKFNLYQKSRYCTCCRAKVAAGVSDQLATTDVKSKKWLRKCPHHCLFVGSFLITPFCLTDHT